MWNQPWSRNDAVAWFGEGAVAALERAAPFRAPLRACRSGPFLWIETCRSADATGSAVGLGRGSPELYFHNQGWELHAPGEETLKRAVESAMPARDDVSILLDVTERLTGWVTVSAHKGLQEPPHFEGTAVTFCALRRRASAPAAGSRNSLYVYGGFSYQGGRRVEHDDTELYCDLLRVVVDTDTCSVDVAVIE